MKEFVILIRDYSKLNPKKRLTLKRMKAKDNDEIGDKVEAELGNSDREAWIMKQKEFDSLKILIDKEEER